MATRRRGESVAELGRDQRDYDRHAPERGEKIAEGPPAVARLVSVWMRGAHGYSKARGICGRARPRSTRLRPARARAWRENRGRAAGGSATRLGMDARSPWLLEGEGNLWPSSAAINATTTGTRQSVERKSRKGRRR